uniref:Uncharacterized protein n=1 Tax=Hyaloperonospora arabidopsidis (strain Emoy2) TaxID=559515 RepID=M4BPE0_HYAAE
MKVRGDITAALREVVITPFTTMCTKTSTSSCKMQDTVCVPVSTKLESFNPLMSGRMGPVDTGSS